MVELLTAAVLLVGALGLLNLLLTFGVIRRLRQQAQPLVPPARPAPPAGAIAAVGTAPEPFQAQTVDGASLTATDLREWAIVAFFSPDCPPCLEKVPEFGQAVRRLGRDRRDVLAVVVTDADSGEPMVGQLTPVAQVVVEPPDGPVARAFRVRQMPIMCLLDGAGRVAQIGYDIDHLLTPATAPV